ncbi:S-layer homology domain-containing protein [Sporomusa sp. KB1]|uniref:S-layer homology domain-containing protein n=1 Tax=Sporomusa sp. KB1 TaxID=943346 RepID=UPI0011AC6401|nr:S-layer homology domain-containing protein [Sporomusa sp. KB1]TWH51769.1 porin [Sporomusa sp. KB1]
MKKTREMIKAKSLLAIVPLALMSFTMTGTPTVITPVYAATTPSFSDVPAGNWAYDAVAKLAKAGIVDGYSDKTFKGDRTMSRYEFAFIVAKAMDKFEAADESNKQLIDKLSAEFASELNRLGARVAKVEAKTNTWVSGETRFRYLGNDPKAGGTKMHGSDRFDFRQRVKLNGTINDDVSWTARLLITGKAGNYNNATDGSNAAFDIFAVTAKDTLGFDKVRIGRFPLDSFTHAIFGKAVGVDGIRIDKNIGKVLFTGAVNNVKSNVNQNTGTGDSGDAKTLTTAQLTGKLNDKTGWKTGYYWSDVPGTSTAAGTGSLNTNVGSFAQSKGWTAGFDAKVGNLMLIGDYVSTSLTNARGLPSSPKGWAVELSSAVNQPPAFFSVKNLVDYKKKGDFGWSVAYRSIDAGAVPSGAGGFDAQAVSYATDPYSTIIKGTDNIKGLFVAFQNTISKNVIWTIEGQDLKIKNKNLTGLSSNDLGKTYMTKFEFYY